MNNNNDMMQPERVVFDGEISLAAFLNEDEEAPWFRGHAVPAEPEVARKTEEYLESGSLEGYDPELRTELLKNALEDGHGIDEVTEYEVRGFGESNESLVVGVRYRIGHNFEPEVKTASESSYTSQV